MRNNHKLASRTVIFKNNINDILQKEFPNRYAHILLDYCGTFSINRDTIKYVLRNDLVKLGGLIWITLCGRDRGRGTEQKLKKLVIEAGGRRYKPELINGNKLFKYIPSGGMRVPMYVMILRRIK